MLKFLFIVYLLQAISFVINGVLFMLFLKLYEAGYNNDLGLNIVLVILLSYVFSTIKQNYYTKLIGGVLNDK